MAIARQYIVDEKNRRTAVLLDIKTFEDIEEALEDAALAAMMRETDDDETYDIDEARRIYAEMRKG